MAEGRFSAAFRQRINLLRGDWEMRKSIETLWKEESGQDLTEYALLLVLVALAAIGSLGTLATAINGVFSNAAANLT
jgi:Flp pilus assembly pilin Flp